MLSIQKTPRGAVFKVLVKPRSFKNRLTGIHGEALEIKFLAKALDVPKSSLEIVSGHTSRNKQVLLHSDRTDISEKEYRRLKQLILNLTAS